MKQFLRDGGVPPQIKPSTGCLGCQPVCSNISCSRYVGDLDSLGLSRPPPLFGNESTLALFCISLALLCFGRCSEGGRRGRRREDPDGKGVVNLWCAGEEPPESLFTKELKRRGLPPTSLLEEGVAGRGAYSGLREEVEFEQEERSGGGRGRGPRKQNCVASADYHMGLENQRERSMALNSEGLEDATFLLEVDSCIKEEHDKASPGEPLYCLLSCVSWILLLQPHNNHDLSDNSRACFGFSISQDNEDGTHGRTSSGKCFSNALKKI